MKLKVFERGIINDAVSGDIRGCTFTKIGSHQEGIHGEPASILILDSPPKGYDKGVVLPDYCLDLIEE